MAVKSGFLIFRSIILFITKLKMKNLIPKNCKGIFFDLYGTLLDYNDMEKSNQIWLSTMHRLTGEPNKLSLDSTREICRKILVEDLKNIPRDSLTTYEAKIQFHFQKLWNYL